ncbi:MAG: CoA transferase [Pseudomonadales bacterium]|nr:CoA transferase [Pseudomonadales bacterium]
MSGPLAGVKILDLAAVVSGPLTATLLADQGAEVVKVERIGSGDIQRHVGSKRNGMPGFFHMLNRGKKSIALDMAKPEAIDIIIKLAIEADVVVQNFRPGVVERLGIGFDQLAKHNDRLIYLSISGFGQSGPQAHKRAYDPIIQTYSGIAAVQGLKTGQGPEQVNQLIMDKLTAYTGSQAICAALYSRSQTGKGQHIELSMLDTAIAFMWPDAGADNILQGDDIQHSPPIGGSGQLMQFADGWGTIMILSDAEFKGMCHAFDLADVAEDARFESLAKRIQNRKILGEIMHSIVEAKALKMSLADAEVQFEQHEVPFARLRHLHDLPDDPQVQHNQVFEQLDHPVAGRLTETRPAALFSATPATAAGPAPSVGEHTRAVLESIDMLDQLDNLVAAGVVGI